MKKKRLSLDLSDEKIDKHIIIINNIIIIIIYSLRVFQIS